MLKRWSIFGYERKFYIMNSENSKVYLIIFNVKKSGYK